MDTEYVHWLDRMPGRRVGVVPLNRSYAPRPKKSSSSQATERTVSPGSEDNAQAFFNRAQGFHSLLASVGIPLTIRPYAVAMLFYETGNFSNTGALRDNNFSGIKYNPNDKWQAGKGAYNSRDRDYFAKYSTEENWANDFKQYLMSNRGGTGRPIDAKTGWDFFSRLAANHYFVGIPLQKYVDGVNAWLVRINEAVAQQRAEGAKYASGEKTESTTTAKDYKLSQDLEAYGHDLEANLKKNWGKYLIIGIPLIFAIRAISGKK